MGDDERQDEQHKVVLAHALYLANLLLAPGIAFLLLCWCRRRWRGQATPRLAEALHQSWGASWRAGMLLVPLALSGLLLDPSRAAGWLPLILSFLALHAVLALMGIAALARVLADQPFCYPLPGLWRHRQEH